MPDVSPPGPVPTDPAAWSHPLELLAYGLLRVAFGGGPKGLSRCQSHVCAQGIEVSFGAEQDVAGRLLAVVVLAAVGISDDEACLVLDNVVLVLPGLVT